MLSAPPPSLPGVGPAGFITRQEGGKARNRTLVASLSILVTPILHVCHSFLKSGTVRARLAHPWTIHSSNLLLKHRKPANTSHTQGEKMDSLPSEIILYVTTCELSIGIFRS